MMFVADLNRLENDSKPRVDGQYPHSSTYFDATGDVEIVSSDDILLKVNAYHLQAASSIFRDMIKIGKDSLDKRIELSDHELETESVLSGLFDIVINHHNILWLSDSEAPHRSDRRQLIIRLAQKYDFSHTLHYIRRDLRLGLSIEKRNPWEVFELAVRLDDIPLSVDAVKAAHSWSHGDKAKIGNGEEFFGESLHGQGLFDLRTYSLDSLKRLPIEVIWAHLRASYSYVEKKRDEKKRDHVELAQRFARLMELKGGPKFA